MIAQRYKKNVGTFIYPDVQEIMLNKTIGIIGCGGNGGYIIEFLARFGVKKILFWDGDTYCESNLNRQIYCSTSTINKNKAIITKERIMDINPDIECHAKPWFFGEREMDLHQIMECDLIVWEADSSGDPKTALSYVRQALLAGIPVLTSPVKPNGCEVCIFTKDAIEPFDVYSKGIILAPQENEISQPAYICALAASLAIEHIIKYFAFEQAPVINQQLRYDIYGDKTHRYDFIHGDLY